METQSHLAKPAAAPTCQPTSATPSRERLIWRVAEPGVGCFPQILPASCTSIRTRQKAAELGTSCVPDSPLDDESNWCRRPKPEPLGYRIVDITNQAQQPVLNSDVVGVVSHRPAQRLVAHGRQIWPYLPHSLSAPQSPPAASERGVRSASTPSVCTSDLGAVIPYGTVWVWCTGMFEALPTAQPAAAMRDNGFTTLLCYPAASAVRGPLLPHRRLAAKVDVSKSSTETTPGGGVRPHGRDTADSA